MSVGSLKRVAKTLRCMTRQCIYSPVNISCICGKSVQKNTSAARRAPLSPPLSLFKFPFSGFLGCLREGCRLHFSFCFHMSSCMILIYNLFPRFFCLSVCCDKKGFVNANISGFKLPIDPPLLCHYPVLSKSFSVIFMLGWKIH